MEIEEITNHGKNFRVTILVPVSVFGKAKAIPVNYLYTTLSFYKRYLFGNAQIFKVLRVYSYNLFKIYSALFVK